MARGGKFAHSSGSMAWAQGRSGAQNIAMAPDAQAAFQAMLGSPPHRAQHPGRRVARHRRRRGAATAPGRSYFTVNFAGPARH